MQVCTLLQRDNHANTKVLESTWKSLNLNLAILKFCIFRQSVTCFYHYGIGEYSMYTSVSHCSLNFECPCLEYGFLSIILVLEKCNLGPWKSLKSALILYFEFATNPVLLTSLFNIPLLYLVMLYFIVFLCYICPHHLSTELRHCCLIAVCPRPPGWAGARRNLHPLTSRRKHRTGWMFLLVLAHPGGPGQRAIKWCVYYQLSSNGAKTL